MGTTEHPELRKHIINYVTSKLAQNSAFTKVYGNNYAAKQLQKNLNKVFVEDYSYENRGKYNTETDSMTLIKENLDNNDITPYDIYNNQEMGNIVTHEGVHAILKRSPKECLRNRILLGTGVLEIYNKNVELGRGINEGLTNWISGCNETYIDLTRFIRILELAIGTDSVMRLGKGRIRKNVVKQLKMSEDETIHFLSLLDDIYKKERELNALQYYRIVLTNYKNKKEIAPESRERVEQDFQILNKDARYKKLMSGKMYRQSLQKTQETDTIKNRICFIECMTDNAVIRYKKDVNVVQELLYHKYFQEKFTQMCQMRQIPGPMLRKFQRLYELINVNMIENYENLDISKFREQFMKLLERNEITDTKTVRQKFRESIRRPNIVDTRENTNMIKRHINIVDASKQFRDNR